MARMIFCVGLCLLCGAASAQTNTSTNCTTYNQSISCNSQTTTQPRLIQPNFQDSFQKNLERAQAIRLQQQALQQQQNSEVDSEELKMIEGELPNATPERRRELLMTMASINPEMAIQYQKLLTLMDEDRAAAPSPSH